MYHNVLLVMLCVVVIFLCFIIFFVFILGSNALCVFKLRLVTEALNWRKPVTGYTAIETRKL